MRHLLANIAIYVIALFLMITAALFGWVRAAQWMVTREEQVLAQFAPAAAEVFAWQELGAAAYRRNCGNCHGRQGQGWDQYPALDHAAMLFMLPSGRPYLIDVHLYGLTSDRWRAPMPPMGHLHDIELAAVLNHLLSHFGNEELLTDPELYLPQEIAMRRDRALTPQQIDDQRRAAVKEGDDGQGP